MQKTVFRFGFYGMGIMLVISLILFLTLHGKQNWEVQEVIGYISIVISLLFVYFGIRHWRDNYNAGRLSFGQGLKLGTLITLFPSVAFGLFTWLEMNVLDPEFSDKYYAYYVEKLKASTPPDQWQQALQKLESEKEMFSSPFLQIGVMFLTVFLIGIVITVISSLILQRSISLRSEV
jgi:Protein of unknown function (DUF4199)